MLRQKHIDASREARLWLVQVIFPVLTIGIYAYAAIPAFHDWVDKKTTEAKAKVEDAKKHI